MGDDKAAVVLANPQSIKEQLEQQQRRSSDHPPRTMLLTRMSSCHCRRLLVTRMMAVESTMSCRSIAAWDSRLVRSMGAMPRTFEKDGVYYVVGSHLHQYVIGNNAMGANMFGRNKF